MANVYSDTRVLYAAGPQTPLYKGMQVCGPSCIFTGTHPNAQRPTALVLRC